MKAWYYKTKYTPKPIELIIYSNNITKGKQLAASIDTFARIDEIFLYRINDYDDDAIEEQIIKINKEN